MSIAGAHGHSEIAIIQNSALGAYAIWRFGVGYQNVVGAPPSFLAAFLVLPAVLHKPTLETIAGTLKSSGLALFASKLGEQREVLLSFHERARELRPLSLRSIGMGLNARLLSLDYANGMLRSNAFSLSSANKAASEQARSIGGAAEKFGGWVAASGLQQAAHTLKVSF